MRVIEPSFEVLTPFGPLTEQVGVSMLQFIERMARISHRSEDRQTEDSWKKFIEAVVLGHGDWSVTEHATITVIFRVDRGCTHELVRHRLFSFTQESTRFVRYKGGLQVIVPAPAERANDPVFMELWLKAMSQAEENYEQAISQNWYPQTARTLLPNALAATIATTGNLRNWRHFFLMRSSRETHPDFRRVVDPLLKIFQTNIPLLFSDIEAGQRQIDNLKKPR